MSIMNNPIYFLSFYTYANIDEKFEQIITILLYHSVLKTIWFLILEEIFIVKKRKA